MPNYGPIKAIHAFLLILTALVSLGVSASWAARPAFIKTKLGGTSGSLGDLSSFSQLAFGPDGHLYATRTEPGQIWRFKVDATSGILVGEELLLDRAQAGNLVNGLAFDPAATAANILFYYSQGAGGGKVYRVKAGPWGGTQVLEPTLLIDKIGIMGNHSINNMAFGRNGRLYITLSGQSYSGNAEKPWTAALGEVDLAHAAFKSPPVLISNLDVLGDTEYTGTEPIKLFATGLRNPNGILQHSNGFFYGTTHDPFDSDNILHPSGTGQVSNATTHFPDMLVRIEKGKYYGHTNGPRKEFLYFGGNPTAGVDPFEIPELPVGTRTAMDLKLVQGIDHHMCIGGLDEFVDGSLLVSYVKENNKPIGHVEWFDLDKEGYFIRPNVVGDVVARHDYIKDQDGKVLEFGGVLDVLVTAKGWVYVADFGYRAGDGGTGDIAGLYLLKPTGQVEVRKRNDPGIPGSFAWKGKGLELVLAESGPLSIESLDLDGKQLDRVFAGALGTGTHFIPFPGNSFPHGIRLLRIRQGGRTHIIKAASIRE